MLEAQARRFLGHAINQKVGTERRVVHARQHRALRGEQFRQAAQHPLIILGQQKAAFLKRRRVDDHQIVRAAVDHLAPGFEQVVTEKADLAQVVAVQAVIVATSAQRGAGHIEVDHMAGAAFDCRHGKAAGVGEQVQHPLARRLFAHPVAAVTHVEKQPGVLLAPQVNAVLQATLDDGHFFDFLTDQPFGRALRQITVLDQQSVRAGLLPLGRGGEEQQRIPQILQLLRRRFLEQRHQHHALQPVHGQLLQPRPAASAPVKQPTGFAGRRRQCG